MSIQLMQAATLLDLSCPVRTKGKVCWRSRSAADLFWLYGQLEKLSETLATHNALKPSVCKRHITHCSSYGKHGKHGSVLMHVPAARVGSGLSDAEFADVSDKLRHFWVETKEPGVRPPACYRVVDAPKVRPDVWIVDPMTSIVVKVSPCFTV